MLIEKWGAGPHDEWFNHIYMARESNEQFLWGKCFVHDQLLGKAPHPSSLSEWASGMNVKYGLKGKRFLGIATLCNINHRNLSAELRVLIDPRIAPTREETTNIISSLLVEAFESGLERIYGYVPCTGSKAMKLWERLMEKMTRRVGHEKHAIRTSRRWIGRTQFEMVKE